MKKDGDPAFPSSNDVIVGDIGTSGHPGLSMRDYFAAKAMQAQIIADAISGAVVRAKGGEYYDLSTSDIARLSFDQAEAMLAEREKA